MFSGLLKFAYYTVSQVADLVQNYFHFAMINQANSIHHVADYPSGAVDAKRLS